MRNSLFTIAFFASFINLAYGMQQPEALKNCPVCMKTLDLKSKAVGELQVVPGSTTFYQTEHICPDYFHYGCMRDWQDIRQPCPTCHTSPHYIRQNIDQVELTDDDETMQLDLPTLDPTYLVALVRFNASLRTGSLTGLKESVRDGGLCAYRTSLDTLSPLALKQTEKSATEWSNFLRLPRTRCLILTALRYQRVRAQHTNWGLGQRLGEAAEQGHLPIVRYLIEDLGITDKLRQAQLLAEQQDHQAIVTYLQDRIDAQADSCSLM